MTKASTTMPGTKGRRAAEREKWERARRGVPAGAGDGLALLRFGDGVAMSATPEGRGLRLVLAASGPASRPVLAAFAAWGDDPAPVDVADAMLALGIEPPPRPAKRTEGGLAALGAPGRPRRTMLWLTEGSMAGRRDLVAEALTDFLGHEPSGAIAGNARLMVRAAAHELLKERSPAWAERLAREASRLERAAKAAAKAGR